MSNFWKDKLRTLRERIVGPPQAAGPSQAGGSTRRGTPKQLIAINLGIDFGTSFTKVCFRDVGREQSGIITFGRRSLNSALVPSVVSFDRKGKLNLGEARQKSAGHTTVRYLKMRLAGVPINDGSSPRLTSWGDADALHRALASWFLATLIHDCQGWITEHERDRVKNRQIVWSANVGVPVEHYDSDKLKIFNEVLAVAWSWDQQDAIPGDVAGALKAYAATRAGIADQTDCHAYPEIAAAVQSFITSREARPGIYIYFDIGGGTVDGVAFDFVGDNGERRVNFYSGKVAPLGVSALLTHLSSSTSQSVDQDALDRILTACDRTRLSNTRDDLQRLVAHVIMTAKRKDNRDWRRDDIQGFDQRRHFGRLEPSRMRPLIIFIGGGGSRLQWYRSTISATHRDFHHERAHIPRYDLIAVPKPKDLDMGQIDVGAFDRFAVAYGLSIPFGEGPDLGLPSQFEDVPRPTPGVLPGVTPYEDTRDAFD